MEITKLAKHLEEIINELIISGQVYDINSIVFEQKFGGDYNYRSSEDSNMEAKKKLVPSYSINLFIQVSSELESSTMISSNRYDDPYKCLMDIKLRIENEIQLSKTLNNFKKKIDELPDKLDEVSFLKIEMEDALKNENYEKAELLRKKLENSKNSKIKKKL